MIVLRTARPRVLVGLYLVQLVMAGVMWLATTGALASVFARRPIFGDAMRGSLVDVILALREHPGLVAALVWGGMALGVAYFLVSLVMAGGLLGHLAGRAFGAEAARWALPFLRLWGWSLLPYGAAVIVLVASFVTGGPDPDALVFGDYLVGLVGAVGPALALVWATNAAVDLARADMVAGEHRKAGRAFLRGWRLLVTGVAPGAHYGLYLVVWLGVSALYVTATFGRDFPGIGGAALLLFLRQAVLVARFLARVTLTGAQLALVQGARR